LLNRLRVAIDNLSLKQCPRRSQHVRVSDTAAARRFPHDGGGTGVASEDPQDGCYEPCSTFTELVTEQVRTLDGREGATAAEIAVGDVGLIEPDRDQPRVVRGTQPQLLDS